MGQFFVHLHIFEYICSFWCCQLLFSVWILSFVLYSSQVYVFLVYYYNLDENSCAWTIFCDVFCGTHYV